MFDVLGQRGSIPDWATPLDSLGHSDLTSRKVLLAIGRSAPERPRLFARFIAPAQRFRAECVLIRLRVIIVRLHISMADVRRLASAALLSSTELTT
jgi:hypothetical protein